MHKIYHIFTRSFILFSLLIIILPELSLSQLKFEVSFDADLEKNTVDGLMLLMISKNPEKEPRFQIMDRSKPQQIFGVDVNSLAPGERVVFDSDVFGYPLSSITEISDGEYLVQALFHRYETFHRADGHVVQLPMDRGEGQQWNKAPGNLFSRVVKFA